MLRIDGSHALHYDHVLLAMVFRREGSVGAYPEPNVVSVRNSTKNLSALANQLRESIDRCAELTANKIRLLQDEHDEKMKCQRLQTKLAVCIANQVV